MREQQSSREHERVTREDAREARLFVLHGRSILEPEVAARYRSFQEFLRLVGANDARLDVKVLLLIIVI